VARFLDIPGGQEIVQESYAQLRKFNCWNISIVQQYSRFKQSRIRSAVFGNSRQFFIMRQNDRADLEDMAQDIALPEVTKHATMKKPMVHSQETRLTALSVAFLPGCAETRLISDAARSGAAYFDLELSNGDPNATAAGAGGVLLSEGLHFSRVGQSRSETAGH